MHQLRFIGVRPEPRSHLSSIKTEDEGFIDLMVVAEAASALKLSRKAVYGLLWSGALGYVRIGRRIRVPREELGRFVRERLISPSSCLPRRYDRPVSKRGRDQA